MAFPIGLPSEDLGDGNWAGRTPEGEQRVIGQLFWNDGIIPGRRPDDGNKVQGTSGWSYFIPAFAALVWVNRPERTAVIVPMESTTVPITPPVGGATRTDTLYVDTDGVVKVNEGSNGAPGGTVIIGKPVIPAGASNTQGITDIHDTRYAIPTGASLGQLHHYHDPADGGKGPVGDVTKGTGTFTLPSDRIMRFDMLHCFSAIQESPTDNPSVTVRWRLYIDGLIETTFTSRATRAAPQISQMSYYKELPVGTHTVHYVQDQIEGISGPGWRPHKGGGDAWPGMRFEVWDGGVAD